MTMKRSFVAVCLITVLFASGCSLPVLKQDIPVTTNPMGARIYANGQPVGTTPATVSLERNRDHILTLVKDRYRQEDVVITRQYQKERVYLKAIQSGVNSGLFFKDPRRGINSGMGSISTQEETGEAYVLVPPAVKLTLTPVSGPAGTAPALSAVSQVSTSTGGASETADAPRMANKEVARELLKIGAAAALSQTRPLEKKVETSSSSRASVRPDGTVVREQSGTSVGAGFNPAGLVDVIDTLFR